MTDSTDRQAPAELQHNWPIGDEDLTGDEHVYVVFHGLFCFGYNQHTKLCEVGTHSKTSDHKFKLFVYEISRGEAAVPKLVYSLEPESHDKAGGIINIDIEEPKEPGVSFFFTDFPKQDGEWRQVIDFEKLYGRTLKKKKGVQKPKIHINNARFVVLPTDFEFLLLTDESHPTVEEDLGRVSFFCFGGTKQMQEEGHVSISTDQQFLRIPRPRDTKLLLFFANSCPKDVCDPPRSDFHEYYKMFKKPSGAKKFKLVKKEDSRARRDPRIDKFKFLNSLFGTDGLLANILSSQDAPCGSMGFGQSPGGTSEPST